MNQLVLPLTAFISIVSAIVAVGFAVRDLFSPKQNPQPGLRRLATSLSRNESEQQSGSVGRFDRWFNRLTYQAGFDMAPTTAALMLIVVGFGAGAIMHAAVPSMKSSVLSGFVVFTMSLVTMLVIRHRRMVRFESHFPNAIDILARAVRAGESLDQAVEVAGDAAQEPVAGEFRRCVRQMQMGRSVANTMQSLSERIDQSDVRIFSSTLSIHREGGGNLPEALDRLAALIRDRLDYRRQMRSVSSGGRLSVMVIMALAPLLLGYLFLLKPEYGMKLWSDPVGRWMVLLSVVGQGIGLFWVTRIFKSEY